MLRQSPVEINPDRKTQCRDVNQLYLTCACVHKPKVRDAQRCYWRPTTKVEASLRDGELA
eukprot:4651765-Amphidinium_carterae.1